MPINIQFPLMVPVVFLVMVIATISAVDNPFSMSLSLGYMGDDDRFTTYGSILRRFTVPN